MDNLELINQSVYVGVPFTHAPFHFLSIFFQAPIFLRVLWAL